MTSNQQAPARSELAATFWNRVRELRHAKKGWSLRDLAAKADVGFTSLSQSRMGDLTSALSHCCHAMSASYRHFRPRSSIGKLQLDRPLVRNRRQVFSEFNVADLGDLEAKIVQKWLQAHDLETDKIKSQSRVGIEPWQQSLHA